MDDKPKPGVVPKHWQLEFEYNMRRAVFYGFTSEKKAREFATSFMLDHGITQMRMVCMWKNGKRARWNTETATLTRNTSVE